MQQIFVNSEDVFSDNDKRIVTVKGSDAKHIAKVLRMKSGDLLRVSTTDNDNYIGHISLVADGNVIVQLDEEAPATELDNKIYLFQAIPKGDRMETIIEKCVELGVYEIIPVQMQYCVVKWDDKKKAKKIARYQAIAEAAAKQSKRSLIPKVKPVMTFDEAVKYANECDINLVPYENANGMFDTKAALELVKPGKSVSIMIGPEGGFSGEEIEKVSHMNVISLGKRILRTDTAGIITTSLVMMRSEIEADKSVRL